MNVYFVGEEKGQQTTCTSTRRVKYLNESVIFWEREGGEHPICTGTRRVIKI